MPTATVVDRPSVTGKVNESMFLGACRDYRANRKLIDALVASDNPDDAFATATSIIARWNHILSDGTDYTPSGSLGFGSSNSSTIAAGLLGEGLTGSQIRKKVSDLGKPKN